jgi:hypothetical protein
MNYNLSDKIASAETKEAKQLNYKSFIIFLLTHMVNDGLQYFPMLAMIYAIILNLTAFFKIINGLIYTRGQQLVRVAQ